MFMIMKRLNKKTQIMVDEVGTKESVVSSSLTSVIFVVSVLCLLVASSHNHEPLHLPSCQCSVGVLG